MSKSELVPKPNNAMSTLQNAGQVANRVAADHIFVDYQMRRAKRTIQTQRAALTLWVQYLLDTGIGGDLIQNGQRWGDEHLDDGQTAVLMKAADIQSKPLTILQTAVYCQNVPEAWQGVTWGLVEGFVKWMLKAGYSLESINNRLSAVKVYTRLAAKAGVIPPIEKAMIREVRGYSKTEGKRVNETREQKRVGYKKEEAIVLTAEQATLLKSTHPPTPQGVRDCLMMCLFLDLGLRASEVAALTVEDLAEPGYITVYRQKTDTIDRMELSMDILAALQEYEDYLRETGKLLRGSRKNQKLTDAAMSPRALGTRVKTLGRDILGVWELSPHDLRHTWATRASKESNPFVLRDAGGWSNMNTPSRYVERAKVVNKGIKLDY
ncbi:MAG: site-specific integrase [Chloroflexi bacterium]|nr:site-specific integrase [Chloroflexota bacterium]